MKAGLLLVSLLAVGLPSAALGLEMSGALGKLSVSFLPTPVRALLTGPGLGRFACVAAVCQLMHAACLMAQRGFAAAQHTYTNALRALNNHAPDKAGQTEVWHSEQVQKGLMRLPQISA